MNIGWLRLRGSVKGMFMPARIPYMPLLADGDSSPYFGSYEGQKYGRFETSCCWDFSACELGETRFEMLWKLGFINADDKKWLKDNNYIDEAGDFYFSRRWVAILSGVRDGGNNPLEFWNIAAVAGLIPNKILPYSADQAAKWITQDEFNNDYFNPDVITLEMEKLGKEFARRFKIQAENLDGGVIESIYPTLEMYLKEGSLQICHPVPQDGTWNTFKVNMPVGRLRADHATEAYKLDRTQDYPLFDYDSYEPHLKQLAKDYYIPIITRVRIWPISTPMPASAVSEWSKFWYNAFAWFAGKPLPYPSIQLGSAKK